MNNKKILLSSLFTCAVITSANAATIDWTTYDITDVSDVSTIGSTVVAISNSYNSLTGTTFDVAGVTFTYDGSLLNGNTATNVSGLTTGDSGYDSLIGSIDYNKSATASVFEYTFDNLVLGQEYLVQVWYADAAPDDRVNTITGTGDNVLQGNDYAIGIFTADEVTQLLEITTSGSDNNNGVRLTGFQLRAIPEPGTYALLAGLIGLTLALVRRRQ
jgi:hypothetical protein